MKQRNYEKNSHVSRVNGIIATTFKEKYDYRILFFWSEKKKWKVGKISRN